MTDVLLIPVTQNQRMGLFQQLSTLFHQIVGRPENQARPESSFRVACGSVTSIGNYRDNNEDRIKVDLSAGLFVVADGMGGQAAGEQASQLAVDIIPDEIRQNAAAAIQPDEVTAAIRRAVLIANRAIIEKGDSDPTTQNMGTTIVLGYCHDGRMYVAHIGDSRAYHLRGTQIERVTTDHNLAQALFEAKTISAEELDTHKFRHVLWKYLGSKEVGEGPDIAVVDLEPGDRFLFATDGLTGSINDAQLAEILAEESDPQACSERLVRLALENGSRDNVSCVVVHILDVPAANHHQAPLPAGEAIEPPAE